MNASVAIQVLPGVTEREEPRRLVDAAIDRIRATGLRYVVGPFETTVEGELEELLNLVKDCCRACVEAGAPELMAYVKISYEPNGVWTIDDKTGKYKDAWEVEHRGEN